MKIIWTAVVIGLTALGFFANSGLLSIHLGTPKFHGYRVTGINMMPTLHPGDKFLVNKEAYTANKLPKRGDIVAYRKIQGEMVARVVGLPGDALETTSSGLLLMNGKMINSGSSPNALHNGRPAQVTNEDGGNRNYDVLFYDETLADHHFQIAVAKYAPRFYEYGGVGHPYLVPDGYVFLLGDNRDRSKDSHYDGPVAAQFIVGTVTHIDVSRSFWGSFKDLSKE